MAVRVGLHTTIALASGPFRVVSSLELDWFINKNPQPHWVPGTDEEFVCTGPVSGPAIEIEGQAWYGVSKPSLVVGPDVQFVSHDGRPISAANLYVGARLKGAMGEFSVTRRKKIVADLYEVNATSISWLELTDKKGEEPVNVAVEIEADEVDTCPS